MSGSRAGRAGLAVEVALCGVLGALAGLVFAGFYSGWSFAPPVAGAAIVPTVVLVVGVWAGWSTSRSLVLVTAGLPLYAVLTVYWGETSGGLPTGPAWSALGHGLADGWAQMLTVGLPADARGDLLVAPVVLAWLAAAGAGLLCRSTSSPLAPLAPPIAALVAALGLVAARGGSHLVITGVFLGVAFAIVLVRAGRLALAADLAPDPAGTGDGNAAGGDHHQPDQAVARGVGVAGRPGPGRGRLVAGHAAFGAPVVAVLAVVGPLAGGVLPLADGDRFDPRDLRDERLEIDDTLSPLGALKRQIGADEPEDLFRLEVDQLPPGVDRVRVAVLDSYDGAHWASTGEYRLAGDDLPDDPLGLGAGEGATTVSLRVTVEGLDGPFLPTLGRPVALDASGAGFDSATGTLVNPGRDLEGYRYEVESQVGELSLVADEGDLEGLRAAAEPVLDHYRTPPPEVPDELRNLALQWAGEADSHAGELLALRDRLLDVRYDDSDDAPPGHSYGALLRMLTGEPDEREGYAEQFATAFALLARERGFATRLAVGYRLPQASEDGSFTVTEAQAHAWPEVALEGRGWVAVEPTDVSQIGLPRDSETEVPEVAADPSEGDPTVVQPNEPRIVVDGSGGPGAGGDLPVGEGLALGGLALVATVLAVPVVAGLAKAERRRRRRTGGDGAAQVLGAWRETVDRLAGNGVPVGPAHTTTEVASLTADHFDGTVTAVAALAPLVSVAIYAPFEPTDESVMQAWQWERAARAEIRATAGMWRQVVSWGDPRPLVSRRLA